MKKLFALLGIIAGIFLINSCKKSDEKLIIGTWELKTTTENFYTDGVRAGGGNTTFEPDEVTIEFKKDNTFTQLQEGEPAQTGTYSIAGDQITVDGEASRFEVSKTNLSMYYTSEEIVNGHTQKYEGESHLEKK